MKIQTHLKKIFDNCIEQDLYDGVYFFHDADYIRRKKISSILGEELKEYDENTVGKNSVIYFILKNEPLTNEKWLIMNRDLKERLMIEYSLDKRGLSDELNKYLKYRFGTEVYLTWQTI